MKTLAFDLDGVIERDRRLPKWLPLILFRLVTLVTRSVPGARRVLRQLATENRIIIVSARPAWAEKETRVWLRLHGIPCDALYLVERKENKLAILRQEHAAIYFDDKATAVEALCREGIDARVFAGWNSACVEMGIRFPISTAHRLISCSRPGRRMRKRLISLLRTLSAKASLPELDWATEEYHWANGETIAFRRVVNPFVLWHATTRGGREIIAREQILRPQRTYAEYADKAGGEKAPPVIFGCLTRRDVLLFSWLTRWPCRLLFDFSAPPRDQILAVEVPVGHRVGFTAYNEVVVLDVVNIRR